MSRTSATVATGSTNTIGQGMLTLTANSSVNFLGPAGDLVFGTASGVSLVPNGFTLTVSGTNFGTASSDTEGANDRLVFYTGTTAVTPSATELAGITFNEGGALFTATSAEIGATTYYDIIPGVTAVPEPSTWVAGLLCLGTLGFSQRRRIGSFLRKQAA